MLPRNVPAKINEIKTGAAVPWQDVAQGKRGLARIYSSHGLKPGVTALPGFAAGGWSSSDSLPSPETVDHPVEYLDRMNDFFFQLQFYHKPQWAPTTNPSSRGFKNGTRRCCRHIAPKLRKGF